MEKCKCGFKFAEPGEFRNCSAFVTKQGEGGIVCPDCSQAYVNGEPVFFEGDTNERD